MRALCALLDELKPRKSGRYADLISFAERVHLRDAQGKETWYRVIDTDNLSNWAEETLLQPAHVTQQQVQALGQMEQRKVAN